VYEKELHIALEAVAAAEKIMLHYLKHGVQAELKSDQTPVTVADRESEEAIKRIIRERFPKHNFFGEEGEKADLRGHRGFTWIIDPIDGTRSYMKGNPLFGTLLALMHDGDLVVGVTNAPLMRERMWAGRGAGCYLNGERVQVSAEHELAKAYFSFGSLKRFAEHNQDRQLVDLSRRVGWGHGIGDFWSYHLVAQGKIDIMLEAEAAIWDLAAVKVLVEEAGGRMTQIDGSELELTGERPMSALASNGALHEAVVEIMKRGS
jgi:histidinol-phosphatase